MRKSFHALLRPVAAAACAVAASGCGDEGADEMGRVTIRFEHEVDGAVLDLETGSYTNAAGNRYSVTHLEYILTEISLADAGGGSVDIAGHHYLNESCGGSRRLSADVPGGSYSALRFRFGIGGEANVTGGLPNRTAYNNMAWPDNMGGGYHYMRLEGIYDDGGEVASFLSHTGPAGGGDFSFPVELPIALEVDAGHWEIAVAMDVNSWFDEPVYDFTGAGAIMGNADAQVLHRDNGADVFTVYGVSRGGMEGEGNDMDGMDTECAPGGAMQHDG